MTKRGYPRRALVFNGLVRDLGGVRGWVACSVDAAADTSALGGTGGCFSTLTAVSSRDAKALWGATTTGVEGAISIVERISCAFSKSGSRTMMPVASSGRHSTAARRAPKLAEMLASR